MGTMRLRSSLAEKLMPGCRLALLAGCAVAALLVSGPGRALADNVVIGSSDPVQIGGIGSGFSLSYDHADVDPWKGAAVIFVKNTGTERWTGFHFQIYSSYPDPNWSRLSKVFFLTGGGYGPTYSRTFGGSLLPIDSFKVTPGTDTTGAILDLVLASNPVAVGDTAVFTIYTDNSVDKHMFGLTFYPSTAPVPIPGAALLLAPGLIGLVAFRKRLR